MIINSAQRKTTTSWQTMIKIIELSPTSQRTQKQCNKTGKMPKEPDDRIH
jgi:hypothetical protein